MFLEEDAVLFSGYAEAGYAGAKIRTSKSSKRAHSCNLMYRVSLWTYMP